MARLLGQALGRRYCAAERLARSAVSGWNISKISKPNAPASFSTISADAAYFSVSISLTYERSIPAAAATSSCVMLRAARSARRFLDINRRAAPVMRAHRRKRRTLLHRIYSTKLSRYLALAPDLGWIGSVPYSSLGLVAVKCRPAPLAGCPMRRASALLRRMLPILRVAP